MKKNRNNTNDIYMSRQHWEENYKRKYEARLRRQRKRKLNKIKNCLMVCALLGIMCVGTALGGTSDYIDETGCSTYKGIYLEDEKSGYVRLENGQEFYIDNKYELGDKVYIELYNNGTNEYFRDDSVVKVTRRWF